MASCDPHRVRHPGWRATLGAAALASATLASAALGAAALGLALAAAPAPGWAQAATSDAAPRMGRAQALQALNAPAPERRLQAITRLAEVGAMADAPRVAERLRLGDEAEHAAAESALWAIWSRSGHLGIDQLLARGTALMNGGELGPALATFAEVVRLRPAFAEGWNKRATVLYLLRRESESLRDCEEVLARNPLHFGALAGMAQIHIRLGDLPSALKAYQRALAVNPRLSGGADTLRQLEEAVREQRRASGNLST